MAGSRGPLGKKPGEHLGHRGANKDADLTLLRRTPKVNWPTKNPDWHQEAQRIYDGLKKSAQGKLFEPSDVAIAYFLCSQIDSYIVRNNRSNGQMFSAIMSGLDNLMGTEAARRRLRVEIVDQLPEVEGEEDPLAALMADYEQGLRAA